MLLAFFLSLPYIFSTTGNGEGRVSVISTLCMLKDQVIVNMDDDMEDETDDDSSDDE